MFRTETSVAPRLCGFHPTHLPAGILFSGFSNDYIPTPPLAAGGRLAFQAEVVGPGVTFSNGSGIWRETATGGVALVARLGDPAPGLGAGATFSSELSLGAFNASQHVLLVGKAIGPGITSATDEMLWSDRSGTLLPIVRAFTKPAGIENRVVVWGATFTLRVTIPNWPASKATTCGPALSGSGFFPSQRTPSMDRRSGEAPGG